MVPDRITVAALAAAVGGVVVGDGGIGIGDVTHDSREAGPGVLFVAVRGFTFNGHDYVATAVDAGSPAVCVEDPAVLEAGATAIVVADTRASMAHLAAAVHGPPLRASRSHRGHRHQR